MNYASVMGLSGKTGEIRSSIAGCSQELRSIAHGLQLGRGGDSIRGILGGLSHQCDSQSQKIASMGSTLQQAAHVMRSAEERVIQNYTSTGIPKSLQGSMQRAKQTAMAKGLGGGGLQPGTGYGGDPVSMFSGSFLWQITPLETYAGEPLSLTLYYDTAQTKDEGLGRGFRHSFMNRIQQVDPGVWGVFFGEGTSIFFGEGEDGKLYSQKPSLNTLVQKNKGFWYYDPELMQALEYDPEGRLAAEYIQGIETRRLLYDQGFLTKIQDIHGCFFDFAYEDKHVKKITDNAGRYVQLDYQGDLLTGLRICLESGAPWKDLYDCREYRFFYDDRGYLAKIAGPDGNILLENAYDAAGRVAVQSLGEGRCFTFTYEGNKTINTEENGFVTEYIHDERGNLLSMTNPLLQYKAEYDQYDRIIKKISNEEDEVYYEYNAFGQLASLAKGEFFHEFFYEEGHKLREYTFNGRSCLKIHYDSAGNPVAMRYPGGEMHHFFYDRENRLIGYEARGESCRLEYNERGWIAGAEAPEKFSEAYVYDDIGRITKIKIENGREITLSYAFEDLVGGMEDDRGNAMHWEYSSLGALLSQGEGEQKARWAYDRFGNVIEQRFPGEDTHRMEYDLRGNLLAHFQGDVLVERLEYDENQRVTEAADGFGYRESYTWNKWNQPTKITNSNGLVLHIGYNANHFLEELTLEDFHVVYGYDQEGRLSSITDGAGRYGVYEYDGGDRLVRVNTFQSQTELTYDDFSNITLISMADFGSLLQRNYDAYNRFIGGKALGELFDRIDWEQVPTAKPESQASPSYGYDPAGRVRWVLDGEGRARYFSYDGLGTLTGIYHLLSREYTKEELNQRDQEWVMAESISCNRVSADYGEGAVRFTDSLGNCEMRKMLPEGSLKSIQDAAGESMEITYDSLLRITGIREEGSHSESSSFSYEGEGMTEAANSLGRVCFDYDMGGRVVGVHYPDGSIAGYEWNQANLCTAMLYPDGSRVEYSYDSFGNLMHVSLPKEGVDYQYDENYRLVQKQSSRFCHTFAYHENGRLEYLRVEDARGLLLEMHYTYDVHGRVEEKRISDRGKEALSYTYAYDKRGLVTKVWENQEIWGEYAYDGGGNRLYSKERGEEAWYRYNTENQLMEKSLSGKVYTYAYNARGDLVSEALDGKVLARYQYNGLGQLLQAVTEKGRADYGYDALGNRLWTDYSYGNLKKERVLYYPNYLAGQGQALCWRKEGEGPHCNQYFDGSPLAEEVEGRLLWDVFDRDQSLVLRLEGEDSYQRLQYSPFGLCTSSSFGGDFSLFPAGHGFGTFWQDGFLNRQMSAARVYDPHNARFQSRDLCWGEPGNPVSFNRYLYWDYQNKQDARAFSLDIAGSADSGEISNKDRIKQSVVAETSIVSKAAFHCLLGNCFSVSRSREREARAFFQNREMVQAGKAMDCLDPITGGMHRILKRGIRYERNLGMEGLDCAREAYPFFSPGSPLKITGDLLGDTLGGSKETMSGLYTSGTFQEADQLVYGLGGALVLASLGGRILPAALSQDKIRRVNRMLNLHVAKEQFSALANKARNRGAGYGAMALSSPGAFGAGFAQGARRQGEGLAACSPYSTRTWAGGRV